MLVNKARSLYTSLCDACVFMKPSQIKIIINIIIYYGYKSKSIKQKWDHPHVLLYCCHLKQTNTFNSKSTTLLLSSFSFFFEFSSLLILTLSTNSYLIHLISFLGKQSTNPFFFLLTLHPSFLGPFLSISTFIFPQIQSFHC